MSAALSLPQKFARGSFLHSHKNICCTRIKKAQELPSGTGSRDWAVHANKSWVFEHRDEFLGTKIGLRPPTCRRYDNTVYITRTIDGIKNHHWCIL